MGDGGGEGGGGDGGFGGFGDFAGAGGPEPGDAAAGSGFSGSGYGATGGLAGLGDYGGMAGDPGFQGGSGYGIGGYGGGVGGDLSYGGGPGAPQFTSGNRPMMGARPPSALPTPPTGPRFNHPSFSPTATNPTAQRSPLLEMAKPVLQNMSQDDWNALMRGIYMGTHNGR